MSEARRNVRIVVLGGGFGGLAFCKEMRGAEGVEITLIDRQNHHLFQPLLYQVATAGISAPDIAQPLRGILSDHKSVTVVMDEVKVIDLEQRGVRLRSGREFQYDYLVIGLGVKTGYFGHNEWEKYAPGLKSLHEATGIRQRMLAAFERAEACHDPVEQRRLMRFIIVGGGPTGVEMAGAWADFSRLILKGNFRRIDPASAEIVLIEAGPRLLTMLPEDLSAYTADKLRSMGVDVRLNLPVQEVFEGGVRLPDESLEAENIVWAAGMEAPPVIKALGIEKDKAGRIKVASDLSLPGFPEVFAVGDVVNLKDKNDVQVPGVAPAALQMGRHVARVIKDEMRVKKGKLKAQASLLRSHFAYKDKGTMATIGRKSAVAISNGIKMRGFIAWVAWLAIHLVFLVGMRNRLAVLLQWGYSYLRYKNGARIIVSTPSDGVGIPSKDT